MSRALVVSQFMETRIPLQQLLDGMPSVKGVLSVHHLEEALDLLPTSPKINFIFIANGFPPLDIANFIERAKNTHAGAKSAYILVLKSNEQDVNTVANSMVVGVHGFLSEPFSIESIENILNVSSAVKLQNSTIRLRAATGLVLSEMFEKQQTAEEKRKRESEPPKDIWTKVQESCEQYKHLTGHSVTTSIVEPLKEQPAASRIPSYDGVSNRVRGMFERKVKENLALLRRKP